MWNFFKKKEGDLDSDTKTKLACMERFFGAKTWREARQVLKGNENLLLTDIGDTFFKVFGSLMQKHGDFHLAPVLEERQRLWERCRQKGIDQSFSELPKYSYWEILKQVETFLGETSVENQKLMARENRELFQDTRAQELLGQICAAASRAGRPDEEARLLRSFAVAVGSDTQFDLGGESFSAVEMINSRRALQRLCQSNDADLYKTFEREKQLLTSIAGQAAAATSSLRESQKDSDEQDGRIIAICSFVLRANKEGIDIAHHNYQTRRATRKLIEARNPLELKRVLESEREYLLSPTVKEFLENELASAIKRNDASRRSFWEHWINLIEDYRNRGPEMVESLFNRRQEARDRLKLLLSEWEEASESLRSEPS